MKITLQKALRILAFLFTLLLILFLAGVLLTANFFANSVTKSAPREQRLSPAPQSGDSFVLRNAQTVELRTSDGLALHARYIPSRNGAAVILVHGYRSSSQETLPIAEMLSQHGYGALLLDLRGHGQSEGQEVTFGKQEVRDLEAAYHYLLNQPEIDQKRIGLFGNSMGATVVLLFAAQQPAIRAVVAQSPYRSYHDLIWFRVEKANLLPAWILAPPIEWMILQRLDADLREISAIDHIGAIAPRAVFLLGGGQDKMLEGQGVHALYDAAGEPKQIWFDPDVGHIDFQRVYPQAFEERITAFYDVNLLGFSNPP